MEPIQGEVFTTVDNTNNIVRVIGIKEAVRRIREHNRIHYAAERNAPIITEILESCARLLEDIDAGKVKYVEYGEWEINCDGYYPYCSNCMSEPPGRVMTDFCPVCGADMRGKGVKRCEDNSQPIGN